MALLQSFDPPAYMNDFDGTPGMRLAWSDFVSGVFDAAIQSELKNVTSNRGRSVATVQFFNATKFDPGGALVEQAITWNAFPKELLVQLGRSRALVEANRLCPLSAYGGRLFQYDPDRRTVTSRALGVPDDVFYRPQVEYCEWHVKRNPLTGEILTLTFTSESSEYWAAMFGQSMSAGGTFGGDFKLSANGWSCCHVQHTC